MGGLALEHLLLFNLTLLAAWISLGPAMLVAVRATLVSGRAAGIATGLGLATMAALWTGMALLGLEAIFTLFPWAYAAFRILGAGYLFYLAWTAWRHARDPLPQDAVAPRRAYLGGLLVNLGNPKSVLFAASVLVVIFPPDLSLAAKALIVANHFIFEVLAYTLLAALFSRPEIGAGYLRLKPWLDRLTAGVLGALGLRLLADPRP